MLNNTPNQDRVYQIQTVFRAFFVHTNLATHKVRNIGLVAALHNPVGPCQAGRTGTAGEVLRDITMRHAAPSPVSEAVLDLAKGPAAEFVVIRHVIGIWAGGLNAVWCHNKVIVHGANECSPHGPTSMLEDVYG